jgi:hypothetical protein
MSVVLMIILELELEQVQRHLHSQVIQVLELEQVLEQVLELELEQVLEQVLELELEQVLELELLLVQAHKLIA